MKVIEGKQCFFCERSACNKGITKHSAHVHVEALPIHSLTFTTLAEKVAKDMLLTNFKADEFDFYLVTGNQINLSKDGVANPTLKVSPFSLKIFPYLTFLFSPYVNLYSERVTKKWEKISAKRL